MSGDGLVMNLAPLKLKMSNAWMKYLVREKGNPYISSEITSQKIKLIFSHSGIYT